MSDSWSVYIVECSDKTLYTGITKNTTQRILDHNTSKKGAKYTRGRRPVILVYSQRLETKSDALKQEYNIKKLSKTEKLKIINSYKIS
jgi:putative endonuclease